MSISLDYAQTRALAKKFRELTGREVPHGDILAAISSVIGMPMDGMMHKLKAEARETAANPPSLWKPPEKDGAFLEELELGMRRVPMFDFDPVMTFRSMKKHPSMSIPDFDLCRRHFLIMLHKQRYSFVLLRIDNLDRLAEPEASAVLSRLSEGLDAYVAEHRTFAACTARGEVAILLEDVDPMDEEDDTLGWFSRVLPGRRQPDQPEVLVTAVASTLDYPMLSSGETLDDILEASRESFAAYNEYRPTSWFIWGPSGY